MSKIDPDEIMKAAARLGRVQMSPQGTQQTLRRARETIKSRQLEAQQRQKTRRLIMRIAIPSGIAAALLLAAGLSVILITDHQATAADQLQQMAQANKAYKGWIHMHATVQPTAGSTLPATQASLPSGAWAHINTADGTLAHIREVDGRRTIDLYLPTRKEIVKYDSRTGEIRCGTMMEVLAKSMAEGLAISPVTVAEALVGFKKSTGRDPEEVVCTRDDGLDRYDVTLFKDEQEARRLGEEGSVRLQFTKITLWADPESRLMQKMQFVDQGVQVSATFSYGKPEIRDIYDLGAPRSAKVIDNRLEVDLAVVLARLDARAVKGLGDCVAAIAVADVEDAGGEADKGVGYVHLYEKEPNRWFVAYYRVGNTTGRTVDGTFLPVTPAGWPAPDVPPLVGQLKDIAPAEYWLMDGDKGWCGWGKPPRAYDHRRMEAKERLVMLASVGLGGEIWPTRYKISMGGTDSQAEIITDSARPGLLGIHVERSGMSDGRKERYESTYWIDPGKDDMPVERLWRVHADGNLTTEVSTKYLEYAQLPDGKWYPKRWQETRSQRLPRRPTTQPHKSIQQYNLIVVPNMTLDKDWFVNLAERFGKVD